MWIVNVLTAVEPSPILSHKIQKYSHIYWDFMIRDKTSQHAIIVGWEETWVSCFIMNKIESK